MTTCSRLRSFRGAAAEPDLLFAHLTVYDSERPDLRCLRTGGDQQVVGPWFACERDVGTRRICLRRCMGVVDDDRLLVAVIHLPPDAVLLHRVEPVEGGRPLGVGHGDEPLRPVGARWPGYHAAGLVRVI